MSTRQRVLEPGKLHVHVHDAGLHVRLRITYRLVVNRWGQLFQKEIQQEARTKRTEGFVEVFAGLTYSPR